MKKFIDLIYIILIPIVLINISCRQENPERAYLPVPPPASPPPAQSPTPAEVWVTENITVELPLNFAVLSGRVNGAEWTAAAYKWEKISGPAGYNLDNPDSLRTKVNNLEKGVYKFKLTATSVPSYRTRSDTMTVKVQDPTSISKQVFFQELTWGCSFFACAITLNEIFSFVPANSPFTLYIRRESSSGWEVISPATTQQVRRYEYSIMDREITVWDNYADNTDHPEVKLVF